MPDPYLVLSHFWIDVDHDPLVEHGAHIVHLGHPRFVQLRIQQLFEPHWLRLIRFHLI